MVAFYRVRLEKYGEIEKDINVHDIPGIVKLAKDIMPCHDVENLVVVTINHSGYVNGVSLVTVGYPNEFGVYLREIFKPIILNSSRGFYIIHNHPSGNLGFSVPDLEVSQEILEVSKRLGSDFVDSLIINTNTEEYFSLREHYVINGKIVIG